MHQKRSKGGLTDHPRALIGSPGVKPERAQWRCANPLAQRTLAPGAWLNRLAKTWPQAAAMHLDGLDLEDSVGLLTALTERANLLDADLGQHDPISVQPRDLRIARTLVGSLKKYQKPVSDVSTFETAAMRKYVENNSTAASNSIPPQYIAPMQRFLSHQLSKFDENADWCACPRFGNGSVEERIGVLKRWEYIGRQSFVDFRDPLNVMPPPDCPPAHCLTSSGCRLCAVPKDWNKRRLITIEPYVLSYLQQTVRSELLLALYDSFAGDLRSLARCEHGSGSDPQLRHRRFALEGSVDGRYATLDLSDASDLVSWQQVVQVFPVRVVAQLERARSSSYAAPSLGLSGDVHMFAGMGNACTFVVETLMFHAACHAIAEVYRGGLHDRPFISVFGDDIVVNAELGEFIADSGVFADFGWRLNCTKSFYKPQSRFRESCGIQAFRGEDVTLLRYTGNYDGVQGAIALADLIDRCWGTDPFRDLLSDGPWPEATDIPNVWEPIRSMGISHVPWWPNYLDSSQALIRSNKRLQRREVLLPDFREPTVFVPARRIGAVYGALAGQLKWKTVTRRCPGRRKAYVSGVSVSAPNAAMKVRSAWQAVVPFTGGVINPLGGLDTSSKSGNRPWKSAR